MDLGPSLDESLLGARQIAANALAKIEREHALGILIRCMKVRPVAPLLTPWVRSGHGLVRSRAVDSQADVPSFVALLPFGWLAFPSSCFRGSCCPPNVRHQPRRTRFTLRRRRHAVLARPAPRRMPALGHIRTQHGVDPRLVPRPLRLEPVQDVDVDAKGDWLLRSGLDDRRLIP